MSALITLVLVIHVTAAVITLGPSFALLPLARQIAKQPQSLGPLGAAIRTIVKLPKTGGPVMVVTGLILVGLIDWKLFTKLWLDLAVVLTLMNMVLGAVSGVRFGKAVAAAHAGGAPDTGAISNAAGGLARVLTIQLAALVVIAILMVWKPGL